MARVSIQDLIIAQAWLLENEGDEGESEACGRVADWIAAEIKARKTEQIARIAHKQTGAPLSVARKAARRVVDSDL